MGVYLPLCACAFWYGSALAHPKGQQPCLCYHDTVVDAESIKSQHGVTAHAIQHNRPFVSGKYLPIPLSCHNTHHLL